MTYLKLENITKSFPGVKALDQVGFEVSSGEIHALCGENGAGKSTLMKILTGNLQPDSGAIYLEEKPIKIETPGQAFELGISIVHQHLSLSENLSVSENVFANAQPKTKFGLIDFKSLHSQTKHLLEEFNLEGIKPKTKVSQLSAPEKQVVEIAKALAKNPSLLILDEPTASLTEKESKLLFAILKKLKAQKVAIIYISHRLEEIFMLSDKISVLKDGIYQGTFKAQEMSEDILIRKMVGRDIEELKATSYVKDEVLLSVQNIFGQKFRNISFELKRGEILGLAGLVGAGRTEIARAIFGADAMAQGQISINGESLSYNHPQQAIAKGIAYVPEDRSSSGLFLEMTMDENIVSAHLPSAVGKRFYSKRKAKEIAGKSKIELKIATPDVSQKVINLSGGNQQKVVLAKWLNTAPEVLIVDEPTHGVDVGAKFEIYNILNSLVASGKGILMISSDMPELLGICDRILVVKNGSISGEVLKPDFSEEKIMALASN